MEEPLWSLMSLHGLKTLSSYMRTKHLTDFDPIVDTLNLAIEMKLDGYNR